MMLSESDSKYVRGESQRRTFDIENISEPLFNYLSGISSKPHPKIDPKIDPKFLSEIILFKK